MDIFWNCTFFHPQNVKWVIVLPVVFVAFIQLLVDIFYIHTYIHTCIHTYITILVYSISFHIDFNTVLFRGPTRRWSTHQLNSIYTVASLGFIYISNTILTKTITKTVTKSNIEIKK